MSGSQTQLDEDRLEVICGRLPRKTSVNTDCRVAALKPACSCSAPPLLALQTRILRPACIRSDERQAQTALNEAVRGHRGRLLLQDRTMDSTTLFLPVEVYFRCPRRSWKVHVNLFSMRGRTMTGRRRRASKQGRTLLRAVFASFEDPARERLGGCC